MKYRENNLVRTSVFWILVLTMSLQGYAQKAGDKSKILFVLSSHQQLGNTGEKTGYYLSEVSHAWKVLVEAGYEIDFVSPLGGEPPVDGFQLDDPINREFWENEVYQRKLKNSKTPNQVDPREFAAIYYAGGHGTMWDFANNDALANLASKIYEQNGVVAAVCHGPAGLLPIKLRDGSFLIKGKRINGFSNEEEILRKLDAVVPFSLEDELRNRGGIYENGAPWQEYVVVDQRVITGQNPASATAVAKAMLKELKK